MTPDGQPEKRHLRTDSYVHPASYASPKTARAAKIPAKPRGTHGAALMQSVQELRQDYAELVQSWEGREEIRARGIIVEFESPPDVELNLSSLMNPSVGLELLSQREEILPGDKVVTRETWFVPDGGLAELERIFDEYLTRNWRQTTSPLRRPLVDSIEKLRRGAVTQLWTEREALIMERVAWFEVWLRAGRSAEDRALILNQFRSCA